MKELVAFLKKHKVYRKFIKNFKNGHFDIENLENFCIRKSQEDYFEAVFIWENTNEGHYFWNKLDLKWKGSL